MGWQGSVRFRPVRRPAVQDDAALIFYMRSRGLKLSFIDSVEVEPVIGIVVVVQSLDQLVRHHTRPFRIGRGKSRRDLGRSGACF